MEYEKGGGDSGTSFLRFITHPAAIACLVFGLLFIAAYSASMGPDEGMWNYIGWLWAQKKIPPYVGAMDSKTPGIFTLFAISNLFFGINFWFPRLVGVIAVTMNSVLLYLIGRELYHRTSGLFAMFFFGFTMCWSLLDATFTAQTEVFMNLSVSLALFVLIKTQQNSSPAAYKRGLFFTGMCLGFAIFFKQIAMFSALGLFVLHLDLHRLRARSLSGPGEDFLFAVAGALTATLLTLTPLFLTNVSLLDYWEGAWLILLKPGTGAALNGRLSGFITTWFKSKLILFYPFLLLYVTQKRKLKEQRVPYAGLLGWFAFSFIGANGSGHYFGHHLKQVIPSMSLISAIGITALFSSKPYTRLTLRAATVTAIIALWLPYNLYHSARGFHNPIKEPYPSKDREVARWVKKHTRDSDYIYILCCVNALQAYCERISPSKYFNFCFLNIPGAHKEVARELERKKPKLILQDTTYDIPQNINEVVSRSYRLKTNKHGYNVYEAI